MKPRLEHANSGPLSLWERVRVRAACTWKALTPCSSPKGRGEPHGMKPRRRRRADRAGYALVLFIMMFFGLMGLAALVIDMGFARLAQRQMQTAVDSAALEGLRSRDAQLQDFPQGWQQDADFQTQVMSSGTFNPDIARRWAASNAVASLFTDYVDPNTGGTVSYGAGPVVTFSGGIDPPADMAASQVMQPGAPPVYQPTRADGITAGLELNTGNAPEGDMVAGTCSQNLAYDQQSPALGRRGR